MSPTIRKSLLLKVQALPPGYIRRVTEAVGYIITAVDGAYGWTLKSLATEASSVPQFASQEEALVDAYCDWVTHLYADVGEQELLTMLPRAARPARRMSNAVAV